MAIEITIPRLGWSMEEGLFAGWLAQPGALVSVGEPLFAVESDKVTMDVESLDAGILFVSPSAPVTGDAVVVGQLLGYLLAPGEPVPETSFHRDTPPAVPTAATAKESSFPTVDAPPKREGRTLITPRARRAAAELGVDTAELRGSGRGGRIREMDVRLDPSEPHFRSPRR